MIYTSKYQLNSIADEQMEKPEGLVIINTTP